MAKVEKRVRTVAAITEWGGDDRVYTYLLRDRLRDAVRLLDQRDVEIEHLRAFAKLVYHGDTVSSLHAVPAWAHDAAAKLLELPSLCHGCSEVSDE